MRRASLFFPLFFSFFLCHLSLLQSHVGLTLHMAYHLPVRNGCLVWGLFTPGQETQRSMARSITYMGWVALDMN